MFERRLASVIAGGPRGRGGRGGWSGLGRLILVGLMGVGAARPVPGQTQVVGEAEPGIPPSTRSGDSNTLMTAGDSPEVERSDSSVALIPGGPGVAFRGLVAACSTASAEAIDSRMSRKSAEVLDEYFALATALHATNLPANPTEVLAGQMRALAPVVLREEFVEADTCLIHLRYRTGVAATLRYVHEAEGWRFDLAREMASALEHLREGQEVLQVYRAARDAGRPAPRMVDDDD